MIVGCSCTAAAPIERALCRVGAQHQQHVAMHHGVIDGLGTDHADAAHPPGVVVRHDILAFDRMDQRRQAGGPERPPWSQSKETRRARRLGFPRRVSAARFIAPSTSLKKEPGASLRLVDPYFDQTLARHIPALVADPVRLAHGCGELLIIVA